MKKDNDGIMTIFAKDNPEIYQLALDARAEGKEEISLPGDPDTILTVVQILKNAVKLVNIIDLMGKFICQSEINNFRYFLKQSSYGLLWYVVKALPYNDGFGNDCYILEVFTNEKQAREFIETDQKAR